MLGLASQLPKPPLQLDTWQDPELQLEAAFASVQGRLHWPQCALEFKRSSQPSALLPLQSPKPALHIPSVQVPSPQALVALAWAQLAPHVPQLTSVCKSVSQPLLNEPSQLSKPLLQVGSQVPLALQLTEALGTLPQTTPQAPQLFTVRRSVSHITLSPLQSALPGAHTIAVHLPPVQYGLSFGHAAPHAPQFAGEPRSVSQPSPPLG